MRIEVRVTQRFFCLHWLTAVALVSLPGKAAAEPTADIGGFRTKVAPLLEAYCVKCHGATKPKAGLSLHDIDPDLLRGNHREQWRLIADELRLGNMPPEEQKQPTATVRQAALQWIRSEMLKTQQPGIVSEHKLMLPAFGNDVDHEALFAATSAPVIPAMPRIWRIRPSIYRSFASTAVGGSYAVANPFSVTSDSGFKDFSSLYFIDEPTTDMLLVNAERVVEMQVSKNAKSKAMRELLREDRAPTAAEVGNAIQDAFRLALQRPATAEEVTRFTAFYDKAKASSDQAVGAKTMLMAVLLQPEAMFRQELGDGKTDEHGRQRLAQREIAYALSFALGDEIDAALLKAADEGKLATREEIAAYVKARLANPLSARGGNPRIMQFFREYFQFPMVTDVFKDQPSKGRHEAELLLRDLEWTIQSILDEDRQVLSQLLTTHRYHVAYAIDSKTLKPIRGGGQNYPLEYHTAFGLPADWKWTDQQPLEFPKDERAGILTHPAWLAAFSGNFDNHPVQRGKWIRTHLLGGTVADLPIGVDARVPEDEHKTLRERLDSVTMKSECWRCHNKMNELGTPFEQYDHYGRFRRFEIGKPVDATGLISRTGKSELDGEVKNAIDLVQKLAKSQHVEQVFIRHAFRFFMGRNETLGDAVTLQQAHQAYRESGGSFSALVVSLLSSDSYLYRLATPTAARKSR